LDYANPLFLHGPTGAGKSCLVSALVDEMCTATSGLSACVLSANDFALPGQEDHSAGAERYKATRSSDLLVVEDVQHLPSRGIEALVELIDERISWGRATVLTALAGPARLTLRGEPLPARLVSRMAGGLVVAVQPLQAASRLLLLQELARRRGLTVSDEVLRQLAQSLTGGRQLEGALSQLAALQALTSRKPTLHDLVEYCHVQPEQSKATIESIVGKVSDYYRIKPRQVRSARRHPGVLMPRQISMYLARRLTRLSLNQIGAYFGGRDHTTVLHACRKIEEVIETDAEVAGAIRQLQVELA
jgi:chromosomal replication initiator protein